jgi:hypothetical protein
MRSAIVSPENSHAEREQDGSEDVQCHLHGTASSSSASVPESAEERTYPPYVSWSHSKDRMLLTCARRFGLHYVESRGGGRPGATDQEREAFRLKQLKSLAAEIGSAVHRRAAECARAVIDGLPLPTLEELVARTREELNDLVRSSRNLEAFLARPAQVPMLQEVYYDAAARLRPELVDRARTTMFTALETLHRSPIWEELRRIPDPRANIIVLDDPFYHFDFDGRRVYAAPDLVFRHPDRVGTAEESWCVVDWKVSRTPNLGDIDQVAVYGVTVVAGFGWPLVEGCEGRVVNLLLHQTDQFTLTPDDLADAGRRILKGTERLWSILMDESGTPRRLTRDDFPMTTRAHECRHCAFKGACHPAPDVSPLDGVETPAA